MVLLTNSSQFLTLLQERIALPLILMPVSVPVVGFANIVTLYTQIVTLFFKVISKLELTIFIEL